jgi:hypothetical protein
LGQHHYDKTSKLTALKGLPNLPRMMPFAHKDIDSTHITKHQTNGPLNLRPFFERCIPDMTFFYR